MWCNDPFGGMSSIELCTASIGRFDNWHDDVITWKHFTRYWPFVRGHHRLPVTLWCFDALIKRLSKHSRGWWFEAPPRPTWYQCNGWIHLQKKLQTIKNESADTVTPAQMDLCTRIWHVSEMCGVKLPGGKHCFIRLYVCIVDKDGGCIVYLTLF